MQTHAIATITLRRLSVLLAFAASWLGLHAAAPEPAAIALQFTVFSRQNIENLGYKPAKGKNLAPLTFYTGNRGPASFYKGAPVVEFFDLAATPVASTTAGATGVAEPQPVARCAVPEGLKAALFLFFPKSAPTADGMKYDVFVVDDSIEKVAPGSFAIINVSGRDYAASYPGASAPIKVSPGVSQAYASSGNVALHFAVNQGERWRKAGRHDFELNSRSRAWVIIYPPDSARNFYPVVSSFIDSRPAESIPMGATVARYP